jgi:glucose-1-phosphate cytidylyltransferase
VKAVILAGGLGTRITEESRLRPKPMIEIGNRPILWHIMKIYTTYGVNEFVICCGYKGYVIKEFFANYFLHLSDVTVETQNNRMIVHQCAAEPWQITLIDTGEETMTGGRLKRVRAHIGDEDFCFTYGDGVGDIDIPGLIDFHKKHGLLATVTATQPQGRFGALSLSGDQVNGFTEKPQGDGGWINGGFFVLNPKVIDYIDGDDTVWEREPMEKLAKDNQIKAWFHRGFWQPMDTMRDKKLLESLWSSGKAPWKIW